MPQTGAIDSPVPGLFSKGFWDACMRHELTYLRCLTCEAAQFNSAPLCRTCGGSNLERRNSEGKGRVRTWSIVWRGPTPAFTVPYAPAIVAVDEGFQMISNIVGCLPEDVSAGLRVHVVFHSISGGAVLPYFAPD